jgi:hypothetical protein
VSVLVMIWLVFTLTSAAIALKAETRSV